MTWREAMSVGVGHDEGDLYSSQPSEVECSGKELGMGA